MKLRKKILLLSTLLLLFSCKSHNAEEYIKSGKSFYQQKNYEKAKLEFRNAIQIDKKQSEAFYHLALIDEKEKNWQGMFANLSQAIQTNPKHIDARLKLAQFYLAQYLLSKAGNSSEQTGAISEQVEAILKLSENHPGALVVKGTVLLKQGKLVEAMTITDKVLAQNKNHLEATSLKAAIYLSQKNNPAALALIENTLQSIPDNLSLNLLKLHIHTQNNDLAAIEKDYKFIIEKSPAQLEFSYALARHYAINKMDDKAVAILQSLIDKNPTLPAPKLQMIDFLMAKKPEQAEKTIKNYLVQAPKEAALYDRLAKLYLYQKKLPQAKEQLNLLIQNAENNQAKLNAKVDLAKLAGSENDVTTASALVEEVLKEDPRHYSAILLKTKIKLLNKLYDESITDLRGILKDYPESDEATVLLAQAYVKKNSPELAEESFRKALELNPGNFSAMMPVVSKMVKDKDILRADKVLQNFLQQQPNNPQALQALAQVRLLQQNWAGTTEVANLIATKPNGAGFSKYLSGKISQGQSFYLEAIEQYKQALKETPTLFDALEGMMSCYEALKQRPVMQAYLEEYIKSYPNEPYPVVLKVQLLMLDKQWDKTLSTLTEANHKWPKAPVFYEAMAKVFAVQNDDAKIIATYQKGLENIPDNIPLAMGLAGIYEKRGEYKNAVSLYESLIAKNPQLDVAVNNLVSLLLDYFPSKENNERALKLSERFKDSKQPYFLDTYGWALFANGNYSDALPIFKQAVLQQPDVAVFRYHLAKTHYQLNDAKEAISELGKALKSGTEKGDFVAKNDAVKLLEELKKSHPAK